MNHGHIWTSMPDTAQSDRVYLEQLGVVAGLRWSHAYSGGPLAASCQLAADPLLTHRALTPGRDVGVTVGAEDVWQGTLKTPTLADDGTRQLEAEGDSAAVGRFVALGLASHNALLLDEVVDAAGQSGRHSRFLRAGSLPVLPGATAPDGAFMMDEALTQVGNGGGQRWRVDRDRRIRFYAQAGDGLVLLLHARQDIGRTLGGNTTRLDGVYVGALDGLRKADHLDAPYYETGSTHYPIFENSRNFTLYLDASGVLTAYAVRVPATAATLRLNGTIDLPKLDSSGIYTRFRGPGGGALAVGALGVTGQYRTSAPANISPNGTGVQEGPVHPGAGSLGPTGTIPPREAVVDLTGQGAYTYAQMQTQLATYLAKGKAEPHYDGTFTVAAGDLRNAGGVPVDLATVQAGFQVLVLVVDPTRGLDAQADDVTITIGQTEYDDDTDTLVLTPAAALDDSPREPYVDFATGLAR